ncbi:glycosyltransferase [Paractinoplanes hotanensis]|uniref:Glycosyltransferase n=1 Tax=Paractinoplanes hotanensis TaxID=2906497 RepID=A0ABT0Y2Q8_9ACTN|nr:glycosyltransferase [Actinoplanes hotanensis]MCM4080311.1 glycosyltransferase [Actinoplanes hotanensis]
MRIAHFCDSHAGRPDGVSRSAALTVALLREAGHTVDFYQPGPFWSFRPAPGLVRSLPVPGRQVRLASPWPRCRPADLVHAHTTGPLGMAGFRLAARWRVPLIVTWHTDLLAYADIYPEVPIGAAWCAAQLRLRWSLREHLELAQPGAERQRRLAALGQGMFARAAAAIAPSAKTAAGFAVFGPGPEICVLPTPVDSPRTSVVHTPAPLEPRVPTSEPDRTVGVSDALPDAMRIPHSRAHDAATRAERPGTANGIAQSRSHDGDNRPQRPSTAGPIVPSGPHDADNRRGRPMTAAHNAQNESHDAGDRSERPTYADGIAQTGSDGAVRGSGRPSRAGGVILSVGRVTAEKNPELLLRAFALLLTEKPEARLVLLGVRLGRARLLRCLGALGLSRSVDVVPPVPHADVAAFFSAADVLAFCSTSDTQSLVLAEAEAHGLPAVVADPGLADRPGGGPPRFTCEAGPHELAAALRRMLDDSSLRTRVVHNGLQATAAYPRSVYLERLVDLYRRHLS